MLVWRLNCRIIKGLFESSFEGSIAGSIEGTFNRLNWKINWLALCTIRFGHCGVKLRRNAEFLLKTCSRLFLSHLAPMLKMPTKVPNSKSDPTRTSQTGFSSRLWIWIRLLSAALCWSMAWHDGSSAWRMQSCKQPVLTKEDSTL